VRERKDRFDDALHATRAAVEEGILPGGGVALLRSIKSIEGIKHESEEQRYGVEIIKKAISAPARQIATNAGADSSVVVGKILEKSTYTYGYDAQSGEYGDLVQGAASIAGLMITTEAMVAELPKREASPAHPHDHHPHAGDMDF
jgi:chaperonin GroEL